LRVAAILKAAEMVISEKGFEAATMAEIASRSDTKIGSLYRFFPNKESLAETLVASGRQNLDVVFEKFHATLKGLSIRELADNLIALIYEPFFAKPALMKLLDAGPEWSAKREEFRRAVLQHIARTLTVYKPDLPKVAARNIALVILLNTKAMATQPGLPPGAVEEFREMSRLYLQSKLH
jgi:AcrR family transcriptional regulator